MNFLLALLILIGISALGYPQVFPFEFFFYPTFMPLDRSLDTGSNWQLVHDLTSNAIHPWRIDPLLNSLVLYSEALFRPEHHLTGIIALLLFCMGELLLLRSLDERRSTGKAFGEAVLLSGLLLLLFGNNIVVFSTLAWLPTVCWLIGIIREPARYSLMERALSAVGLTVLVLLGYYSANQYLLLFFLFTLLLHPAVEGSVVDDRAQNRSVVGVMGGFIAGLLSLSVALTTPLLSNYDYPAASRVVPAPYPYGNVLSHVGATPALSFVDLPLLSSLYLPAFVFLFLLSLFGLLRTQAGKGYWWGLLSIAVIGTWGTLPYEALRLIGPIASFQRCWPGWMFLSPVGIILAFLVVGLYHGQRAQGRNMQSVVLLFGLLSTALFFRPASLPIDFGILERPERAVPFVDFEGRYHLQGDQLSDHARKQWRALVSPSYPLFWKHGLSLTEWLPQFESGEFSRLRGTKIDCFTSNGRQIESCRRLRDNNERNRWSAMKGKQEGDEWLAFHFPKPLEIRGIELDPGRFVSDYPRGLRIETLESCLPFEVLNSSANRSVIFQEDEWKGPLLTTPSGLPYIGHQSDVRLFFSEPVKTTCLRVRQTEKSETNDWSVSEVRFLVEENISNSPH